MQLHIDRAEAMAELGRKLGQHCLQSSKVYLQGDLGAGKTTLVRGFLQARGYQGKVKSPTYSLVEPYTLDDIDIYHFDLYRLHEPEELEQIGFRDYFDGRSIILLEWPEKAASVLNAPDLMIVIKLAGKGRDLELQAKSTSGQELLLSIQ